MKSERITAVILAGGEGRRLRPITESRPKPLVPIGGQPTLFHIIDLLAKHGVSEAVLTTAYRAEDIRRACGEERNGVRLRYTYEARPLGTAGGVLACEEFMSDTFFVISGDCFCELDLTAAFRKHRACHAEATLLLSEVDDPTRFGIVLTDARGRVTRFEEKPSWNRVFSNRANTGVYVLEKSLLRQIPSGVPFDFSKDLFPQMLEKKQGLYALADPADWCDIGDAGVLLEANLKWAEKQRRRGASVYAVGLSLSSHHEPHIREGGLRGASAGTVKEERNVFGRDCQVGEGSIVSGSLFFDGVTVGRNCQIEGAILCEHVTVGDGVTIGRGSVVGGDCLLEDGTVLPEGCRLPRHTHRTAEENEEAMLPFPLTLASGEGFYGSGEELSPAVCRALGRAMALTAGGGKCAVCAMEGQEARKEAILCGMEEAGGVCCDLGVGFDRLAAFAAIHLNSRLTACVSGEGDAVRITLWDGDGLYPTRDTEQKLFSLLQEGVVRPRTADERDEESQKGRRAVFSDVGELYVRSLVNLLPERLPFARCHVAGEGSAFLAEALKRRGAVLCEADGADVSIFINSRGEGLRFAQGDTAVDGWHAAAIIARSEVEKGAKKIVLPFHSPLILEKIADGHGGKTEYYSFRPREEEEKLLRASARSYLFVNDASHGAAKLTAVLAGEGRSLTEEEQTVPPFARCEEELSLPDGILRGRLLTRLAEEQNAACSDGILLDYGKSGQVHLRPDAKGIEMAADSYDFEQAEELMALSRRTIERLLKKDE